MRTLYNILLVLTFLLLASCNRDDGINTSEEIAAFINIEPDKITHLIENNDSILVFYEPMEENLDIGIGWIKSKNGVWEWVHGNKIQNQLNEDITYSWSNLDKMTGQGEGMHLFWGIINNDSVDKVHISYRNEWELNEYAELIEVGNKRVWYVLSDYYYGTIPGVNIVGFNASGEQVYEHY